MTYKPQEITYLSVYSIEERRRALVISSATVQPVEVLRRVNIVAAEIVPPTTPCCPARANRGAEVDVVIGLGGGSVMDAAKLRGAQLVVPVTCVPTLLSTDAFLTSAAAVREAGRVVYLSTGAAHRVIIDEALLLRAPAPLNALGCCDVLSILTASDDWLRDSEACPPAEAIDEGRRLCETLLAAGASIAAGGSEGLHAVLDALLAEVRLCAEAGCDRLEEGSEHYFAYALETRIGRRMHGALVGLGILVAARLQGQDIAGLSRFMRETGIAGFCLAVPAEAVVETICAMPAFVRDAGYPTSIWNRIALDHTQASRLRDDVLAGLRP